MTRLEAAQRLYDTSFVEVAGMAPAKVVAVSSGGPLEVSLQMDDERVVWLKGDLARQMHAVLRAVAFQCIDDWEADHGVPR